MATTKKAAAGHAEAADTHQGAAGAYDPAVDHPFGQHQATYTLFLKLVKWGSIATVAVVVLWFLVYA